MGHATDPAREFTDLCQNLKEPLQMSGADYLAQKFEVLPWSTDFMIILASLHKRITTLHDMLDETALDADIKQVSFDCLEQVRNSFALVGLSNAWPHSIQNYLTDANLRPIRMASAYVRPRHGYTIPDESELEELLSMIGELLDWLRTAELTERDFIRTAIIEGLSDFEFRVRRVGWFGWPDTFESLKAIVSAYIALERGQPDLNVSTTYEATLKKLGGFLQKTFDRFKFAKDVQETGDWALRIYGALHAAALTSPTVAGLLPHSG